MNKRRRYKAKARRAERALWQRDKIVIRNIIRELPPITDIALLNWMTPAQARALEE